MVPRWRFWRGRNGTPSLQIASLQRGLFAGMRALGLAGYRWALPRISSYELLSSWRSGMARVNEGSYSFTCHPYIYPQMELGIERVQACSR